MINIRSVLSHLIFILAGVAAIQVQQHLTLPLWPLSLAPHFKASLLSPIACVTWAIYSTLWRMVLHQGKATDCVPGDSFHQCSLDCLSLFPCFILLMPLCCSMKYTNELKASALGSASWETRAWTSAHLLGHLSFFQLSSIRFFWLSSLRE